MDLKFLPLLATAAACLGSAEAMPEMTMHIDFAKGAKAVFAKGSPEPLSIRNVTFEKGKVGTAAKFSRKADSQIVYSAKDNLPTTRGAITLWYRYDDDPENSTKWGGMICGDGKFHDRFGTAVPFLWGYESIGVRFDPSADRDVPLWIGHHGARPEDTSWHFLAVSWDEREGVKAYLDGIYARQCGYHPATPPHAKGTENVCTYARPKVQEKFFLGTADVFTSFSGYMEDIRFFDGPMTAKEARQVWLASGGREEIPDYKALYADARPNPYEGPSAGAAGLIPRDDLELVAEIKFDKLPTKGLFRSVGTPAEKELAGTKYLEWKGKDRFAWGVDLDPNAPLHLFEIDYPDDAERTMDFIIQQREMREGKTNVNLWQDYTMQVGVATGRCKKGYGFPLSNRIQTHRCIYWTRSAKVAFCGWGGRAWDGNRGGGGDTVAVSAIRVYRVKSGRLPVAKIDEAPANKDGWNRSFGFYFEDSPLGTCFATPSDGYTPEDLRVQTERLAATMKFTGQNFFAYPGAFYEGLLKAGDYDPHHHAPEFLSGMYEIFDREGLGLAPLINQHFMPFKQRELVTEKSLTDGSLHPYAINYADDGTARSVGCYRPKYNFAHPDVQAEIEMTIDKLLKQGAPHKSFRGIGIHLKYDSLCWFGSLFAGYNDYAIEAFERAKGIKIPVDRKDPLRAKGYADWIRANALEAFLDWRCEVVSAFWIRQAQKLAKVRPDAKLWMNAFTMLDPHFGRFFEKDYIRRTNRIGGLDGERLTRACPNIILSESLSPMDYRAGLCASPPADDKDHPKISYYWRLEDLRKEPGFYDLLTGADYPLVHLHDRYFESDIARRSKPGEPNSLTCDWLTEHPWRVATENPGGRYVLEHIVGPLRFNDILGFTKGGFLIGTYGAEEHLARFAQYFRALPAVRMADAGGTDVVKVRACDFKGRRYLYIANTTDAEQTATVEFPAGARDVVTGETLSGKKTLTLPAWEFRSYVSCLKSR